MALWTPADLTVRPVRWWDAQEASTISRDGSDGVSEWRCRVSAYPLGQASAADRPLYQAGGLNGRPTLFQSREGQMLAGSGVGTPTADSFMIGAVRCDDRTGSGFRCLLMWGGHGGEQARALYDRDVDNILGLTSSGGDFAADAIRFRQSEACIAGFSQNYPGGTDFHPKRTFVDGVGADTNAGRFRTPANGVVQVGRWTAYADSWIGAYSEFVILDYYPATDDRNRLEGYMAWKWGTQVFLPSTHPYRYAAPSNGGSGLIMAAGRGAVTLAGQPTGLLTGHRLPAAPAAVAISSPGSKLLHGRRTQAASRTIDLSGPPVALRRGTRSSAARGVIALSGGATGLYLARRLIVQPAGLIVHGQPVTFNRMGSYAQRAASGAFVLFGQPTTLRQSRRVAGGTGAIQLSGIAVAFRLTGLPPSPVVPSLRSIRIYDQARRLVPIF